MSESERRLLSQDMGAYLQAEPTFVASYLPRSMAFARLHRETLQRALEGLPTAWPFEDRVFARIVPGLARDVGSYARFPHHDLGDYFDDKHLEEIDAGLVQRLVQLLHDLWGLRGSPSPTPRERRVAIGSLDQWEQAGIIVNAPRRAPTHRTPLETTSGADAQVRFESGIVHVTLDCAGSRVLKAWTSYRRLQLYHLLSRVLQRQLESLAHGPAHLASVTLMDVASTLGVSESSASRLVSGLSVATPHGVWPVKALFQQGAIARAREVASIIADEDKTKPYTDEQVAEIMEGLGTPMARRTAAKYRQLLGIPGAQQRRVRPERTCKEPKTDAEPE